MDADTIDLRAVAAERRRLVKASVVAAIFGINIRTVYLWASQGRIPCMRFRQPGTPYESVRFDLEKIEAVLKDSEQGVASGS